MLSSKLFLCNAYLFDQTHPNEASVHPQKRLGLCACYELDLDLEITSRSLTKKKTQTLSEHNGFSGD